MPSEIDVVALEQRLAPLSHSDAALQIVRDTLSEMGKKSRQDFMNEHLVRDPIYYDEAASRVEGLESFHALQGDVVRTSSAFIYGDRYEGNHTYVIATSTCDLVSGRRNAVYLLPVEARTLESYGNDTSKLKDELGHLFKLDSNYKFYLPPLSDDGPEVVFNLVRFDPFAQCKNEAIQVVERRASMTLIGWRLFGASLSGFQIREAAQEAAIRSLH